MKGFLGRLLARLLPVVEGARVKPKPIAKIPNASSNRLHGEALQDDPCGKSLSAVVTVGIFRKSVWLRLHLTDVLIHSVLTQEMETLNFFLAEKTCSFSWISWVFLRTFFPFVSPLRSLTVSVLLAYPSE